MRLHSLFVSTFCNTVNQIIDCQRRLRWITNGPNVYLTKIKETRNRLMSIVTFVCSYVAIRITSPCDLYPLTPHLYSKTGVYRGIHYFLIFALKHRLWVLVRTASVKKTIRIFHLKIIVFTNVKYCSILHSFIIRRVCVMQSDFFQIKQ